MRNILRLQVPGRSLAMGHWFLTLSWLVSMSHWSPLKLAASATFYHHVSQTFARFVILRNIMSVIFLYMPQKLQFSVLTGFLMFAPPNCGTFLTYLLDNVLVLLYVATCLYFCFCCVACTLSFVLPGIRLSGVQLAGYP